jgi:hypothetical protein
LSPSSQPDHHTDRAGDEQGRQRQAAQPGPCQSSDVAVDLSRGPCGPVELTGLESVDRGLEVVPVVGTDPTDPLEHSGRRLDPVVGVPQPRRRGRHLSHQGGGLVEAAIGPLVACLEPAGQGSPERVEDVLDAVPLVEQ